MTGDHERDFTGNRTKRIFDDRTGSRCDSSETSFAVVTSVIKGHKTHTQLAEDLLLVSRINLRILPKVPRHFQNCAHGF
jgi:hypothetical protein